MPLSSIDPFLELHKPNFTDVGMGQPVSGVITRDIEGACRAGESADCVKVVTEITITDSSK